MKVSTRGVLVALFVSEMMERARKVKYSFRGLVVSLLLMCFFLTAYLYRYEPVQGGGRFGITMVYDRWLHRNCFVPFPDTHGVTTYICHPNE